MMDEHEWNMIAAINAARAGRGIHALVANEVMAAAAERHAQDMATHPGMVHIGSDGTDGGDRLLQEGYYWRQWAEVVAWGWGGEIQPAVEWWLNSPDHVGIILDADMTDIGVGYARGTGGWSHYWCVDFGTRETVQPRRPVDAGVGGSDTGV